MNEKDGSARLKEGSGTAVGTGLAMNCTLKTVSGPTLMSKRTVTPGTDRMSFSIVMIVFASVFSALATSHVMAFGVTALISFGMSGGNSPARMPRPSAGMGTWMVMGMTYCDPCFTGVPEMPPPDRPVPVGLTRTGVTRLIVLS